jgi:hypothetical protein
LPLENKKKRRCKSVTGLWLLVFRYQTYLHCYNITLMSDYNERQNPKFQIYHWFENMCHFFWHEWTGWKNSNFDFVL